MLRSIRVQLVLLTLVGLLVFQLPGPQPSNAAPNPQTFSGSISVPEQVTFSSTGSLTVARSGHTATLLSSGKVLVVGGKVGSEYLASAEVYDPATGTWSTTGSMAVPRHQHTATMLSNGKVLVVGGTGLASTEVYDPATGTWSTTGSMAVPRYQHTATLLSSGKVLVVGGTPGLGYFASAEVYDPTTGTWNTTGSMAGSRRMHTATLLNNGKVLVVGGEVSSGPLTSSEVYDPATGAWSTTGSLAVARYLHTATLLNNGKVLVVGGAAGSETLTSAEVYDPATDAWSTTGSLVVGRYLHTATLLNNGKILVVGGYHPKSTEVYDPATGTWNTTGSIAVARYALTTTLLNNASILLTGGVNTSVNLNTDRTELGTLIPANTLTATLLLPAGWLNSSTFSAQFVGTTSAAALAAGSLSNDTTTWGDWVAATPGVTVTTTWTGGEGANKPIYLRVRDVNDQTAMVVTGTVNIDLTKPSSTMSQLQTTSPTSISLAWSGTDALSDIESYQLQVRTGNGPWTEVFTNTSVTSTIYNGEVGKTYAFRVRARDVAGNVEDWPADADTSTLVDTDLPTGTLMINHGAQATTAPQVALTLAAQDVSGAVAQMRFSHDATTWGPWQPYASETNWTLASGDGLKTIYVQFKDVAGNEAVPISNTITLDTAIGTKSGLSINDGALFTNQVTVTLATAAPAFMVQMQLSNDGGFASASWEPYNTHRAWQITQYGSYVLPRTVYVRYRDASGTVFGPYQDDIILDVTPPTGGVTIAQSASTQHIAAAGKQAQVTANNSVTLNLSATDDVSGVGSMRFSNRADFAQASWQPYVTTASWTLDSNGKVYVQFKDNAGNISQTYMAQGQSSTFVFLPLVTR